MRQVFARFNQFGRTLYCDAQNQSVARKFTIFVVCMLACPLIVLFLLVKIMGCRETIAGIAAVVTVNIVIALYVIMAIQEPQSDGSSVELGDYSSTKRGKVQSSSPNRVQPRRQAIGKE